MVLVPNQCWPAIKPITGGRKTECIASLGVFLFIERDWNPNSVRIRTRLSDFDFQAVIHYTENYSGATASYSIDPFQFLWLMMFFNIRNFIVIFKVYRIFKVLHKWYVWSFGRFTSCISIFDIDKKNCLYYGLLQGWQMFTIINENIENHEFMQHRL